MRPLGMKLGARLHICMTCKAGLAEDNLCLGSRLFNAISTLPQPLNVTVVPVDCLSACNTGAVVALSQPGSWGYVYGRMTVENAADILAGAAAYARTADGLVPWRERPVIFRKQSLARIPPMET